MRRSMTEVVLDASAILAFLRREPGSETVQPYLRGGRVSTVNHAEVLAKAVELGIAQSVAGRLVTDLGIDLIAFDENHAAVAASLRAKTRTLGLSLADRSCLALAIVDSLPVLTADRRWKEAKLKLDVRVIR